MSDQADGWWPRPWRAWNTFQASILGAFLALTAAMVVAGALRITTGELTADQTRTLLQALYWGSYPLVFLALASLIWHAVRSERGDYA